MYVCVIVYIHSGCENSDHLLNKAYRFLRIFLDVVAHIWIDLDATRQAHGGTGVMSGIGPVLPTCGAENLNFRTRNWSSVGSI